MRVIIVSYYFPPLGLAGVARPVALANYLARQGREVFVVSVRPIAYPAFDRVMESQIDPRVQIVRVGSTDPARLQHFLPLGPLKRILGKGKTSKLAASMFPDSKVGFVPGAVSAVEKLIAATAESLLITTSPPVSAHLVGLKCCESKSVTWLADFRDIWSSLPYTGKDREEQGRADALLQDIIGKASLLTATSPKTATSFANKGASSEKVLFVPNGFAENDFTVPADVDNGVVGLYGTLNHLIGFERLAHWLGEFAGMPGAPNINLRHTGYLDLPNIEEILKNSGLTERFRSTGYLPHPEAVAAVRRSAVNLLALSEDYDTSYVVPSKLWELLRAEPPLIAILPPGNAARTILEEHSFPGVWIADSREQFAVAMQQAIDTSHRCRGVRNARHYGDFEWTALFTRLTHRLGRLGA